MSDVSPRSDSNHRWGKAIAALDRFDDILIGPVPIGPFAKGNHFPAEHAEAPHIGRRREFSIVNRFDRRPSYGNLPASRRVTIIGIDLSTQTEVRHLADQVLVHENIPCRQILCNRSYTSSHTNPKIERTRWTYFISAKYFIPEAMPHSIRVNCTASRHLLPSLLCND